jgi:hypothetical protein
MTLVYEKTNISQDLCRFFPQHLMIISSDMKVMGRYDFLSVSGQIRDDEKWCDLYRHVAGHHASSTLPIHT